MSNEYSIPNSNKPLLSGFLSRPKSKKSPVVNDLVKQRPSDPHEYDPANAIICRRCRKENLRPAKWEVTETNKLGLQRNCPICLGFLDGW